MKEFEIKEGAIIRGDSVFLNADRFKAGYIDMEVTRGLV